MPPLFIAFLAVTAACDDDPVAPSLPDPALVGRYAGVQLSLGVEGDMTDFLASGAVLTVTLREDWTTDGVLRVTGALDEELGGFWYVTSDGSVRLVLDVDIFLERIDFNVTDVDGVTELRGSLPTDGAGTFFVGLRRSGDAEAVVAVFDGARSSRIIPDPIRP